MEAEIFIIIDTVTGLRQSFHASPALIPERTVLTRFRVLCGVLVLFEQWTGCSFFVEEGLASQLGQREASFQIEWQDGRPGERAEFSDVQRTEDGVVILAASFRLPMETTRTIGHSVSWLDKGPWGK